MQEMEDKYQEALKMLKEYNQDDLKIYFSNLENYQPFNDSIYENDDCFAIPLQKLEELVNKEKPFKPTPCNITLGRCKCGVGFTSKETNYCGNCGQKIDWEE